MDGRVTCRFKTCQKFFKKRQVYFTGDFLLQTKFSSRLTTLKNCERPSIQRNSQWKKIYQDFHLYISVKICWRFFLPISLCKSWICPNIDFNCTSLTSVCIFVINHQKVADTVTLDKVLRLMYSNTPITCHCYICKGGVIEDVLYTLRNYIESEYINIAFKT